MLIIMQLKNNEHGFFVFDGVCVCVCVSVCVLGGWLRNISKLIQYKEFVR